jgi:hypothetical protein
VCVTRSRRATVLGDGGVNGDENVVDWVLAISGNDTEGDQGISELKA